MYERVIYKSLLDHIPKKQVTVITGMRRVGKSTAVKYLLEQIKHSNKFYLDCERVEVRVLLNRPNYESIVEELQLMGADLSQPCIIALDEIQLVENLPSLIKYIYDTYHVKFIVTGSSSYYMKNHFSESLAGRKRIFEMYPLSFNEFLQFKKMPVAPLEKTKWQTYNNSLYTRYSHSYEEYIRFGGFPEVVLEKNKADKVELLNDIINSHIELDIKLLSDYLVSEGLYKLVKLLAARTGNKVDFSKLGSLTGINRQKIAAYIQLLEYTYLIYLVTPYTNNIDTEISHQPKLYFSDTGILNTLAGDKLSSGQLFENAIAAQLRPQGEIHYYQKKTGQEIDFIFKGETAIEVKETAIGKDNLLLRQRASSIGIKKTALVGRYAGDGPFEEFVWGGHIF
jgi:predicted AAA+ superfamily ATPase